MKNLFTIEPQLPFLDTLASELWRQTKGDGFILSQYLILLPTRRACRHLGVSFAKIAQGKPLLLPRMQPLGDIDEDEMSFVDEGNLDILPAIAPLKRLMLLTQQVQASDPEMSWDQAAKGAEALARFLDQIQIEQCDVNNLPSLIDRQELAIHWQQTIAFLEIVTKNWPLILAEEGCLDPATRRNMVLEKQAALWSKNPPAFPIIAAGSTGSMPATATLLNAIVSLDKGIVILPGLDRDLDNAAWQEIDETHPQHSMKNLLAKMKIDRKDVRDFGTRPSRSARTELLGQAMRPAGLTEEWRELSGKLDIKAVAGLTQLTLDHPQEEAQVIALRLRAHLEEPNKTTAFVTGDRSLATRVAALLQRWGIRVDDSGGTPLAKLPLGAFLELVLSASKPHAGITDILALLKHPFAACGLSPVACRTRARAGEIKVRNLEDENFDDIRALLKPLSDHWRVPHSLSEHIKTHIAVAEKIAASDSESGADRLWRGENGKDVAVWLNEWSNVAKGFPALSRSDYADLFGSLASTKIIRSSYTTHPRLSILGPLEARLINADLIILGAMNEGTWPPDPGFDPWMSRQMRKKFNLPTPEFRIGLAAHDFSHLVNSSTVMLTRSLRTNGTPTVASRFLLQIDAVLRAAGLSNTHDALAPKEAWRAWANLLDKPDIIKACERPQPRPPLDVRPKMLSVTEIGTWLRNPYAIYAKHILKLTKLEELDTELDASDRGIMIHKALEKFIRAYPQALPENAEQELVKIGKAIFAHDDGNPRVQAFWWTRFLEITAWFINEERQQRLSGINVVKAEPSGRVLLNNFTLTGRADRIDRTQDGGLVIVDYKTGAAPTKAQVESGIEPQLQLLAFIASQGGFKDIDAASATSLEYWILKGHSASKRICFNEDLASLIEEAKRGLEKLIAVFSDPQTPYEAVPKRRLEPRHNDYAHLSRIAEWGRTAEEP